MVKTDRDKILNRIVYSHYLEKIYSTALGRIDKLISVLLLIFGSAIVINGNPVLFGILVAVLAAIQSTYQFGKNLENQIERLLIIKNYTQLKLSIMIPI